MSRITPISWEKFEKFLLAVGCTFKRQEGDHRIYTKPGLKRPVVIPAVREIPVFIIQNNLRVLSISRSEYLSILGEQ